MANTPAPTICVMLIAVACQKPRPRARAGPEDARRAVGCAHSNTSVPNFWNSWKLGPTRAQSQLVVLAVVVVHAVEVRPPAGAGLRRDVPQRREQLVRDEHLRRPAGHLRPGLHSPPTAEVAFRIFRPPS